MSRTTKDLLVLLKKGTMDRSDFILIALNILENEGKGLADRSLMDAAIKQIKIDYLDMNYDGSISKLIEMAGILTDTTIAPLFETTVASIPTDVLKPEDQMSRRYFENKLSHLMWRSLATDSYYDSLDRLAKFMVGENIEYAADKPYKALQKVKDLSDMQMVISAIRDFVPRTAIIQAHEDAMRTSGETLSSLKDRGAKRSTNDDDIGYSLNPGIIKANSPMPEDERLDVKDAKKAKITDTFLINREKEGGYSAARVDIPFVNSVSGTAYTLAAVLQQYALVNATSATLPGDLNNIAQTFVYFTCMQGYHSLSEMKDVLASSEVKDLFIDAGLTINVSFTDENLNKAIDAAQNYAERRLAKSLVHRALLAGSEDAYPRLLALKVNERSQTLSDVMVALQEMFTEGESGNRMYTKSACLLTAQKYMDYMLAKGHSPEELVQVTDYIRDRQRELSDLSTRTERTIQPGPGTSEG